MFTQGSPFYQLTSVNYFKKKLLTPHVLHRLIGLLYIWYVIIYPDEESMDEAEIEALLYSQIYFEKNDNEEEVQPDTGYDVVVREEKDDKSNVCSAFASIVNFSGRSYMSEVKTPLKLATEDESKGTSTCEWSEQTLGNAKSALKKLLGKISGKI